MPIRTTFYFDGFNFYNGLKSAITKDPIWKKYYWLDLVKFADQFISKNQIITSVKYFTAEPLQPDKAHRQSALFKANKLLNGEKVEFIKGKYTRKRIRCMADCRQTFSTYEEKRTDVNISVQIMGDCAFDKTDVLVLISADSDLVPTIEYLINYYPQKTIKVFFPPCRRSDDLRETMKNKVEFLDLPSNRRKFESSVMLPTVRIPGDFVTIPAEWVLYPSNPQLGNNLF